MYERIRGGTRIPWAWNTGGNTDRLTVFPRAGVTANGLLQPRGQEGGRAVRLEVAALSLFSAVDGRFQVVWGRQQAEMPSAGGCQSENQDSSGRDRENQGKIPWSFILSK